MAKNERLSILKMIESGRLTAEEGLGLLEALDSPRQGGPAGGANDSRRVRLVVTELGSGRRRAQLNVPVSLVDMVLRLTARVAGRPGPDGGGFDPRSIAAAVHKGSGGRILDLTDDIENVHLEVFVE